MTNTGAAALNGPFNPKNTGPYEWQVPKGTDDVTILARTKSKKATATIDGNPFDADTHTQTVSFDPVLDAATGNMIQDYNILVTAENTTSTLTYQVRVIEEKSHEAGLQNLTVSVGALNPAFVSGTTTYTDYILPWDTTSVDVTPTTTDDAATMTINSSTATSGTVRTIDVTSLPADASTVQTVTIIVTAEDGETTRTYTIGLRKECQYTSCTGDPTDAHLTSLSVIDASALTPEFGSDTFTGYEATTNTYSVDQVVINAVPRVTGATVVVNTVATDASNNATLEFDLPAQDLNVTVIVTSIDSGHTETYTLTVHRALNDDASLSNLTVSAGALDPVFATGMTAYNVELPYDAMSVNVTATLNDTNASMTIDSTEQRRTTKLRR